MEITEVLDLLNKRTKYPDMGKRLKQLKQIYYEMSLHTLGACPWYDAGYGRYEPTSCYGEPYQRLFDYKLLNRHPRESEETRNWRYSVYRPMTKAPFSRATELITGAIFQDGNYSIEIPNKQDEDYVWGKNFHGHNLVGYFANPGFKHMTEDPNGVFVIAPKYAFYETEDEVEPNVWFISTTEIHYVNEHHLVFDYNGYGWYIDHAVIYRFVKTKSKYELAPEDADGYYAHMLGKLPMVIAGGEWNTRGYYDSFYDKAKAAADEFINTFSAAQLVDKEASYPYITEASVDCPDCKTGQVQVSCAAACGGTYDNPSGCTSCDSGIGYSLRRCGTCGGSGQQPTDPAKRRIVPSEDMAKGNKFIDIQNPDTSINTHHRKTSDSIMGLILDALHLSIIDEAQSGAAKAIDQDRQYKFISKISNHIFDNLITPCLSYIIAYRNVTTVEGIVKPNVYDFTVVKPAQFDIKTAKELLDEYKEAFGTMPYFVLQQHCNDFVDKQFGGNDVMKKKSILINKLDAYALYPVTEMTALLSAGQVTTEQFQYHLLLPQMIDNAIDEKGNEWFLNASDETLAATFPMIGETDLE